MMMMMMMMTGQTNRGVTDNVAAVVDVDVDVVAVDVAGVAVAAAVVAGDVVAAARRRRRRTMLRAGLALAPAPSYPSETCRKSPDPACGLMDNTMHG